MLNRPDECEIRNESTRMLIVSLRNSYGLHGDKFDTKSVGGKNEVAPLNLL